MAAIKPLNVLAQRWEVSIKCQTFQSSISLFCLFQELIGQSGPSCPLSDYYTHTVQMERERDSLPWDIYTDGPVRPKQTLALNLCVFEDSTRACMHVFVCLLFTHTYLKVGLDVFWHDVLRLRFVLAIYHIHVKPSFLQFVQTERELAK